jgi:hypothetical protein
MNAEADLVLLRNRLIYTTGDVRRELRRVMDLRLGPWYRPNARIRSEHAFTESEVKRLQQLATKNCELKMGQSSGLRRV